MAAGGAEQAKASSVAGEAGEAGRSLDQLWHWPHVYTCTPWVWAAGVWVEWHADNPFFPTKIRTGLSRLFLLPVPSRQYVLAPQAESKL